MVVELTNLLPLFLDGKFDPESMPSKVQEAEIDDGVEDMMPMGYPDMPERKEYLWSCDLEGIFRNFRQVTQKLFR